MANVEFVKGIGFDGLKEIVSGYYKPEQAYNVIPQYSAYEFASVQQYWGYDTQNNISVIKITIAADEYINQAPIIMHEIGLKIVSSFWNKFQVLLYVGNQIEIAVNPVSFVDGSVLVPDETWMAAFIEQISMISRCYATIDAMRSAIA